MADDHDNTQAPGRAGDVRGKLRRWRALPPRTRMAYVLSGLGILIAGAGAIALAILALRPLTAGTEGVSLFLFLAGAWMGTVVTWSVLNRRRRQEAEEAHRDLQELTAALASALKAQESGAPLATPPVAHETPSSPRPADEAAAGVDAATDEASPSDAADLALREGAPSRFSRLTLDELSERLVGASDPLAELRLIEADVSRREKAWMGRGLWSEGRAQARRERLAARARGEQGPAVPTGPDPDPQECPIPSGAELYLAHRLRESGLFDEDVEMPRLRVVRPHRSGMFYLRVEQPQVSYAAMLVVLRIEAALNAVRFASNWHDDPDALTERDIVCFMQRLTSSVAAQAEPIDSPAEPQEGTDPDGEWAVRHAIAEAIESFQLPYRLQAEFRANVADGNVAFELALTPADVFPRQYYPADFPTAAPLESTRITRRQLASAYALRLAVLLAACAFRTTEKVKHVWVAGVLDSGTRHDCYFSIDFDRWRFAKVDLEEVDDLERVLHPFCPVMRLEDGFLRPVVQAFSLSEERFCPRRRYESVSLSARRLSGPLSSALGTDHVSGLAIGEADKREVVANDILRHLASPDADHATEHNVRAILEIAGDDPDPSVRQAAERTVAALAAGSIADDPFAVVEEFVSGDELSRAVREAGAALENRDVEGAWHALEAVLAPIEAAGTYEDSATVEWRHFSDFVDRTLYNRLREHPERSLMLVPEGYFDAQSLAVTVLLWLDRAEAACAHARELIRIAPLDTRSHLQLVRSLENAGKPEEATDQLRALLRVAHDPQSVGTAYYRMAYFQWELGNVLAARACYATSLRFIPGAAPQVAMEIATLAMQGGPSVAQALERDLSEHEVSDALASHDIPDAPTSEISDVFFECARASVDAEIFPVARNFLSALTAFTPDDVMVGLMRSLEDAPDSL